MEDGASVPLRPSLTVLVQIYNIHSLSFAFFSTHVAAAEGNGTTGDYPERPKVALEGILVVTAKVIEAVFVQL